MPYPRCRIALVSGNGKGKSTGGNGECWVRFVVDSVWIPFLIGFPNMVYWQFVCYFVWKNRGAQP